VRLFIIALAIFSYTLSAQSFVDVYRKDGIKSVQNIIEQAIQSESYWQEYLKDKDLSFGYFERDNHLVISSKSKKVMQAYKNTNNQLQKVFEEEIIVGKDGDKQKEGDLKTPIGVYSVTSKFEPKDIYYGPIAFSLSYPNLLDRLDGKNGYGIWIHGYPTDGSERPDMSKGCLVLKNDLLLNLETKINPTKTYAITFEDEIYNTNKDEIAKVMAFLYAWRDAWRQNDLSKYLDFYDKKFKRFDGMNKEEFSAYKSRIFNKNDDKSIIFKDISIILYPTPMPPKQFVVTFFEDYKSSTFKFQGNKELYVELINDQVKIIAEQ
jgi:murein L,D-transpeptidase YafK